MEPSNLNPNPRPDDEQPDAWLRRHASLAPLPDDGFSRRVLTALPPPARRPRASARLWVILLGAAAGTGLAAFKSFTTASVEFGWSALGPETTATLAQLTDPQLHVALGVTVLALAFAFWPEVQRRLGL